MDALTAGFSLVGGGGVMVTIGIAIGKSLNTRTDIQRLAKKLHDIEDWRNATLPRDYVQKEALALQLKPLTDSIGEMKTQQGDIAKDLKTLTRWMDQHGGLGV
jgi:hypothetical protein